MTRKELAEKLGISEATVSYALNNKPGVSVQMRNKILDEAGKYGIARKEREEDRRFPYTFYFLYLQRGVENISANEFGTEVYAGVVAYCQKQNIPLHMMRFYSMDGFLRQIDNLKIMKDVGIILLATEMKDEEMMSLSFTNVPIVILDNHFRSTRFDSIEISNEESAFFATDYLIKRYHVQPGYLHSSASMPNFEKRKLGFEKALVKNGMSKSNYTVHSITPSIKAACSDMLAVIEDKEPLARCYFADNDYIAIGVIKAFQEKGIKVPEDVAVIGFDDVYLSEYTSPALTTIHVPKRYMGILAGERLTSRLEHPDQYPINIQVSTNLVVRDSM